MRILPFKTTFAGRLGIVRGFMPVQDAPAMMLPRQEFYVSPFEFAGTVE
jgi:hypothetical protein